MAIFGGGAFPYPFAVSIQLGEDGEDSSILRSVKIQARRQRLKDQRDHLQSSTVALQNEKAEAEAQAAGENGRSGVFLYFGAGIHDWSVIYNPPKRKKIGAISWLQRWFAMLFKLYVHHAKPLQKSTERNESVAPSIPSLNGSVNIFRAEKRVSFRKGAIHESITHLLTGLWTF